MRAGRTLRLLVLAVLLVVSLPNPPASAQAGLGGDDSRRAFDPARDDPTVLAEWAAQASREGTLAELQAWLDSLRVSGSAGRNALMYWGALSLQRRVAPDSVAAAFMRYLAAHPDDAEALTAFAEVLEANAAIDQAEALRRAAGRGVGGPDAGGGVLGSPQLEAQAVELERARRSGDVKVVRQALERAIAGGLSPARLAVPRGDLYLARGAPDSALGAYAAAVGAAPRAEALEALERLRLVRSLQQVRIGPGVLATLGAILVTAPADLRAAVARLDSLAQVVAGAARDSTAVQVSLLAGLKGEWLGRLGQAAEASRTLEAAAEHAGFEGAGLLLAAGRWARVAGDEERARRLWRGVVELHPGTPHDLEARRLLSEGESAR